VKAMRRTVLIFALWVVAGTIASRSTATPVISGPFAVLVKEGPTDDATLVEKSVMIGVRVIQASEVAETKVQDPSILNFARLLIQEHSSINQALMDLSGTLNIQVPTDAIPRKPGTMDTVNDRAGPDYEKNYLRTMVKDHMKAVSLYKRAGPKAQTDQLRDFYSKHLAKLEELLKQAEMLQTQTSR
jgi:putative membrane protein